MKRRARSANCTCSCTRAGAHGTITVTAPRRRSERKSEHLSSREVVIRRDGALAYYIYSVKLVACLYVTTRHGTERTMS